MFIKSVCPVWHLIVKSSTLVVVAVGGEGVWLAIVVVVMVVVVAVPTVVEVDVVTAITEKSPCKKSPKDQSLATSPFKRLRDIQYVHT